MSERKRRAAPPDRRRGAGASPPVAPAKAAAQAALARVGRPVESHLYEQGGHGFGMCPKETTSTGWFDGFVRWFGMHGYLERRPAA